MIDFSHLQIHSHYSISEGLCRIDDLVDQAKTRHVFALALTDIDNMFAWIKFYTAARKGGVKPIAGVQVLLAHPELEPLSVLLLCLNDRGYHELIQLLSDAYRSSERALGRPVIPVQDLLKAEGIVVIVDSRFECVQHALDQEKTQPILDWLKCLSPFQKKQCLFGSLVRIGMPQEALMNERWMKLAIAAQLPLVATNAICFHEASHFEAHEIRICVDQSRVIQDKSRVCRHTKEQYFKSATQMHTVFSDAKVVLGNTNNLAKRCNVRIDFGQVFLPEVDRQEGVSVADYFMAQVQAGLADRIKDSKDVDISSYHKRIEREVKTITDMGFVSYFLIVADFIQWSRDNKIPVGPGRGSGAGSLVAYALGITDIDPLKYDLLFERFLNPERVSMPDFDIDFCMVGRDKVIDYVVKKYGRANVSQIITFGTMAAKAVIRDVGRVLGHPYPFVDKLAKLVPFDIGITLSKAMGQEPMLAKRYEEESDVRQLVDLCLILEGVTRNVGTHAGGVVIAPSTISEFSPTYNELNSPGSVSQYDKDDIEKIGLVKFDFLGLRTLTIIDWACQHIKQSKGLDIHIADIPLDDEKTFDLLQGSLTTAVFQLESQGMKDLIDRLVPDSFEDIIALVALYRPGPLQSGMVDDFVQRKHGQAEVSYLHPVLEPILNTTYGVVLYQEQVMQIAQDLGGYSLGAADLLRRAMGKKKPEEMAKQRSIFLEGSKKNGVDPAIAESIFELMEKFAGYGFNKSHSAAYALLSYQTAWLKANHTAELMAAVLSSDMDNTDKLIVFLEDAVDIGLTVNPPCINNSGAHFTVQDKNTVRYGLAAIKGVGTGVSEQMASVCQESGPFKSLLDLCLRLGKGKVNRRLLESLIKSGACDIWDIERSSLLASIDLASVTCQQSEANDLKKQQDLFGADSYEEDFEYVSASPLSLIKRLKYEKESLGYYLSGHPVDVCLKEVQSLGARCINRVKSTDSSVLIAGVINKKKVVKTKRGGRIAFVELEDHTGRIDVAFFDDVYEDNYELLATEGVLIIEGQASVDQYTQKTRLQCKAVMTLDGAREARAPGLHLVMEASDSLPIDDLMALIHSTSGKGRVVISYQSPHGVVRLTPEIRVGITDDFLEKLLMLPSVLRYEVLYHSGSAQLMGA